MGRDTVLIGINEITPIERIIIGSEESISRGKNCRFEKIKFSDFVYVVESSAEPGRGVFINYEIKNGVLTKHTRTVKPKSLHTPDDVIERNYDEILDGITLINSDSFGFVMEFEDDNSAKLWCELGGGINE